MPNERVEEVLEATGRALARDERIYWICPVIEGGEDDTTMAAVERHRLLAERFGGAGIRLVHGRLASADKEAALASFARGDTRLLVATTVVEVGVDVPEASIIVVEHAEGFGLAQLHQLRGRVGRGERPSACLLLCEPPLNAAAQARLAALRETEDGFRMPREDLRLRGPGEVLGVRQSGLPSFCFVDLATHRDLLAAARAEAKRVLRSDPILSGEREQSLTRAPAPVRSATTPCGCWPPGDRTGGASGSRGETFGRRRSRPEITSFIRPPPSCRGGPPAPAAGTSRSRRRGWAWSGRRRSPARRRGGAISPEGSPLDEADRPDAAARYSTSTTSRNVREDWESTVAKSCFSVP